MPANLTPQYLEAEKRFRAAKTPQDKIAALEEMLAVIPKHKGTEHLQGDLKRRLAKLRAEAEQARRIYFCGGILFVTIRIRGLLCEQIQEKKSYKQNNLPLYDQ